MGYSKHIRAIIRVQPYLDQLVTSTETIEFASEDPSTDAYAIREGIYAARQRALTPDQQPNEPYYSYSQLNHKYIFKTVTGRVICQIRHDIPILRLQQVHNTMRLPAVQDEMGVVGAAIAHSAERMHFPSVSAEDIDLEAIHNWTSQNGYHIIASSSGITLTKTDPGTIAWTPSE